LKLNFFRRRNGQSTPSKMRVEGTAPEEYQKRVYDALILKIEDAIVTGQLNLKATFRDDGDDGEITLTGEVTFRDSVPGNGHAGAEDAAPKNPKEMLVRLLDKAKTHAASG